jgi:hypothetical protein
MNLTAVSNPEATTVTQTLSAEDLRLLVSSSEAELRAWRGTLPSLWQNPHIFQPVRELARSLGVIQGQQT